MSMKFSELIKEYARGPWAELETGDRNHARALRVAGELGHLCTVEDAKEYLDRRMFEILRDKWNLQNSSMNRYIAAIDSMGFEVKYLPVARTTSKRILTTEQLDQLDANVRADHDDQCKAIYAILRDTGCRGLTELNRVKAEDINWETKTVIFSSRKGNQGEFTLRTVPLSSIAFNALAWRFHNPSPINDSRWRAFWLRVRVESTHVPYDLRHTFCTRLLDADIPLAHVMRAMGHTNIAQTLHYQHQRPSSQVAIRDALD